MISQTAQASMCDGKQPYASPALAHSINRKRNKMGKNGQVYRCLCCGLYHIGRQAR